MNELSQISKPEDKMLIRKCDKKLCCIE